MRGKVASLLRWEPGSTPKDRSRKYILTVLSWDASGGNRRKFDEIVAFSEVEKFLILKSSATAVDVCATSALP